MNNYIPLTKAINPVCIYDGSTPLINKKLGVDAMTISFNGTPSEHVACAGAPEMFIKVEQDGLYYFGVEADDKGSLRIGDDEYKICYKTGEPPNGKLALASGARYLKAGYYKVFLDYGNNSYTPVSNNAIAFNVTMDSQPIQKGDYSKDSTMKRTFSASPKLKLWTIERESSITCELSKKVEVSIEEPEPVIQESIGECKTTLTIPQIYVTACKDEVLNEWRIRVQSVCAGSEILVSTGGYRDALRNPPTTEEEAIEAVNCMNRYQSNGRGAWHTREATLAHENHHSQQGKDAFIFYWDNLRIQDSLELQSFDCEDYPEMDDALEAMKKIVVEWATTYLTAVLAYIRALPDKFDSRPYCAGQKVLNEATRQVIALADAKGWDKVPRNVTEPGTIEPPCFLPPVHGTKSRSMEISEEQRALELSIVDTSQFMQGKLTVCFRNKGKESVRIPNEINDKTANFYFITRLKAEQGTCRILNAEMGKMTFHRPLNYRNLAQDEEYRVTIPIMLDQKEQEEWENGPCELETIYYNQQGQNCFLGTLRATAHMTLS